MLLFVHVFSFILQAMKRSRSGRAIIKPDRLGAGLSLPDTRSDIPMDWGELRLSGYKLRTAGIPVSQRCDLEVGMSTLGPGTGRGLFLLMEKALMPREIICVYGGKRLTVEESRRSSSKYLLHDEEADYVVDAEGAEKSGFLGGLVQHGIGLDVNCAFRYRKDLDLYVVEAVGEHAKGNKMELFADYGIAYNMPASCSRKKRPLPPSPPAVTPLKITREDLECMDDDFDDRVYFALPSTLPTMSRAKFEELLKNSNL